MNDDVFGHAHILSVVGRLRGNVGRLASRKSDPLPILEAGRGKIQIRASYRALLAWKERNPLKDYSARGLKPVRDPHHKAGSPARRAVNRGPVTPRRAAPDPKMLRLSLIKRRHRALNAPEPTRPATYVLRSTVNFDDAELPSVGVLDAVGGLGGW